MKRYVLITLLLTGVSLSCPGTVQAGETLWILEDDTTSSATDTFDGTGGNRKERAAGTQMEGASATASQRDRPGNGAEAQHTAPRGSQPEDLPETGADRGHVNRGATRYGVGYEYRMGRSGPAARPDRPVRVERPDRPRRPERPGR